MSIAAIQLRLNFFRYQMLIEGVILHVLVTFPSGQKTLM